jgi:hypothetical protein
MPARAKDWDKHVVEAEEIARGRDFQELRDAILARANLVSRDPVVDIGAPGTGCSPWRLPASRATAASAGTENVEAVIASAVSLSLADDSADLVVPNYD